MAPGGGQFAGFWIRFVTALIDGLIVGIPVWILIAATGAIKCTNTFTYSGSTLGYGTTLQPTCTVNAGLEIFAFLIPLAYFLVMWAMGGTLGQKALSLHVVDANTGATIGYTRSFIRVIGYIVASIPLYLGLIWAGFDQRKQGWHDKIASTVVVRR